MNINFNWMYTLWILFSGWWENTLRMLKLCMTKIHFDFMFVTEPKLNLLSHRKTHKFIDFFVFVHNAHYVYIVYIWRRIVMLCAICICFWGLHQTLIYSDICLQPSSYLNNKINKSIKLLLVMKLISIELESKFILTSG